MKRLLLIGVLLLNSQMVMALPTYWLDINVSSIDHGEQTSIDYTNLTAYYFNSYDKNNYYVTTWVQKFYLTDQRLANGKTYHNEKSFWYVDCNTEKYTIGDIAYYDRTGKFVGSSTSYVYTYSSNGWARAIPNSIGHGIGDAICTHYQLKMRSQKSK